MKVKEYLKDKSYALILFLILSILEFSLLFALQIKPALILILFFLHFSFYLTLLCVDFTRKRKFYTTLMENSIALDKSYLVLETIEKPTFYEGKLVTDVLYTINKSYLERIQTYETKTKDFQEYIELWIHEIKIPISVLTLMAHNHKERLGMILPELKKIEDAIEQVLYYVRQETPEKDYLINKVSLEKIISNVALKNKDALLNQQIDFIVENVDTYLYTDSKWLEFIINQIVQNAMKYKNKKESYIKITTQKEQNQVAIVIEDNGMGIPASDIPRVCEKSFTGHNGRIKGKSTGMGLYIVKNLCDKLGHEFKIQSKKDEYTKVLITISKTDYYDVF